MSRVTLTGKFTRIDGSPATGTVRVTPSRSPIMDSAGRVVISGPQSFPVQSGGLLEVEIPASNDPDLGPAFTYRIEVILDHASWKISKVWIPHGSVSVDLSQVSDFEPVPGVATRVVTIPADGTDGQVLVWDGAGFSWMDAPTGPPGPPGEVTTSALTTALAGKVTGTGMTLRLDTTVGTRVLLDHPTGTVMLSGDTGWRNVTSLVTNGWVATFIYVRRTTTHLLVAGYNVDGTNASNASMLTLPTGFTPLNTVAFPFGHHSAEINANRLSLPVGAKYFQGRFGEGMTSISTLWPSTQPGTPATH